MFEGDFAEPTIGVVVDCEKLNIRFLPTLDASAICEVPAGSELMIDLTTSTANWYCVCTTAGVEGYCMKHYVEIKK